MIIELIQYIFYTKPAASIFFTYSAGDPRDISYHKDRDKSLYQGVVVGAGEGAGGRTAAGGRAGEGEGEGKGEGKGVEERSLGIYQSCDALFPVA